MSRKGIIGFAALCAACLVFGATALAQTATPGATPAETPPTDITPSASPVAGQYSPGGGPFAFAGGQFARTWMRTDLSIAHARVSRTWFWGPGPDTPGLLEQYNQAPGGGKQRLVQYFDKSRMEINDPGADINNPFYVTNGLLTVEMVGGYIQVGDNDFEQFHPACIPVTGDAGNTTAVTYAALQGVSNTQSGDHPAPNRVGQPVTATIDASAQVGDDPTKAGDPGVQVAQYITETQHNIPRVFWDFLNEHGPVVNAPVNPAITGTVGTVAETLAGLPNPEVIDASLINPWFYASGLPISEAYWTKAPISGKATDVLVQAFQRRTLTYVASNPRGFQVEMGNIGQHYYGWRYLSAGYCPGELITPPSPPVVAPTGTVVPVSSPTAASTAIP